MSTPTDPPKERYVRGIDHIAIAVVDLEEAIAWYTQKLGFRIVERRTTRGEHTSMLSAVVTAGEAVLVLLQGTSPQSQISRFIEEFGPGVQHIALCVQELDKALDNASAAGAQTATPVMSDVGLKQVFLDRDTGSGVRVELIERNGGSFSETSIERLFRAFEAADMY